MRIVMLLAGVILCAAGAQRSLADGAATRSIADGVFSEQQKKRGLSAYMKECSSCHGETFRGGEAMFGREDRQAGVDEREEADGQVLAHSSSPMSSCAVTTASAMSAIRRPECIALRRSSA